LSKLWIVGRWKSGWRRRDPRVNNHRYASWTISIYPLGFASKKKIKKLKEP
jgi:hypothetical protein